MKHLPKIPFYFLRHGETEWNRQSRVMGQNDIPLNEKGIEQAHLAKQLLQKVTLKTICTSPLKRSKMTAEIVNLKQNLQLIEIEELKEFNLGSFETKEIGPWFEQWREGLIIDGSETYKEFIQRARIGIEKALSQPGPVLIVAHGGIYWSIQHEADLENCIPMFHSIKNDDEITRVQ